MKNLNNIGRKLHVV